MFLNQKIIIFFENNAMKKFHIALLSVFGLAAAVFGVLPQVAQRQETAAAAESLRLLQGTPPKGDSAGRTRCG